MNTDFQQAMRDSDWASICRRAEGHLALMSGAWSSEARAVAAKKLRDFVSQPSPKSHDELQVRFSQTMGLTSIIGSVSHVELMLGKYPDRKADRLRLAEAACSLKLPTNRAESGELYSGTMAVSMQVSSLSFDELALARRRQVMPC